ncbi:dihydroxyacetone kinase subunit L [Siminovitchia sp. 179-K 8D1 HS]|uniref:dihydroxyacetone kinase subunit L n=1 Tax=Siminovitchia sp. 179-K 8D1 HS TaxID=3142385 RepID=UPI0039A02AED
MSLKKITRSYLDFAHQIKDELNNLDGKLGDGDLGNTVLNGAKAIYEVALESDSLQTWFVEGGKAFRRAAPSTMGILLASALIKAGKKMSTEQMDENSLTVKNWGTLQREMVNEIQKRGGARIGDKTILDSLIPAVEAFEENEDENALNALQSAKEKAKVGAESTKGMKSKTGRSSWLGERANEHVDGGAWLCYLTYEFLFNNLQECVDKGGEIND